MTKNLPNFFDSTTFMPHGHCFLWYPEILWLHVISDATIALAYFAIPVALLYLLRKRKDLPFENIFILFAAFILLCGATHVVSIWVLWNPDYAIEGMLKAATAIASLATVFFLVKLTPRILAIPGHAQLAALNKQLEERNIEREELYAQLKASSETALARSEQRYELVVRSLSLGLWDWNVITNDLFWSPGFYDIIGAKREDIKDRYEEWESRLHPDDRANVIEALFGHVNDSSKPYDVEYRLMHMQGHYVWIHAKGQAVWDATGKATRMVGSIEDISARKQSERDIFRYVNALKRSNQELDDFAYIASHDLKEPLRGLSNNAMFLREDFEGKLDEEGMKRLNRITYLCERMERLVNDLLYFSRLGRQELAVQSTNLNHVVHDVVMLMENTLQQAHAKVEIPKPLPTIICDLPRITEVYRNLITNAVKYNDKAEKRIEVGSEVRGGETIFFVRDNGMGIPEEFYGDVFRIFKRLNSEDDSVKGTGVGLTFVKKIIERHQGRIWIESVLGQGTTFYFTIREPVGG